MTETSHPENGRAALSITDQRSCSWGISNARSASSLSSGEFCIRVATCVENRDVPCGAVDTGAIVEYTPAEQSCRFRGHCTGEWPGRRFGDPQVELTAEQLSAELLRADVVSQRQLLEANSQLTRLDDAASSARLLQLLVASEALTEWQAEQIPMGRISGLTIGNYLLRGPIGRGGMGQVFLAIHRTMKREVALKLIAPELLNDEQTRRRFLREVQAAASLSHPNIVTSHDAGEVDGQCYLVMEFIRGRTLSEIVRRKGPLRPRDAVRAILQVSAGLAYAHRKGVVHRDIKPGNLLCDESGTVRILDMGLARFEKVAATPEADAFTESGTIVGTVDYMSPEQAMDSRKADARSDLYSLGCTLYFLMHGRPVFIDESPMMRLMNHQSGKIPILTHDADLQKLFESLLAKRPQDRPESADHVIGMLSEWLNRESGSAERHQETFSQRNVVGTEFERKRPADALRNAGRDERSDEIEGLVDSSRDSEATVIIGNPDGDTGPATSGTGMVDRNFTTSSGRKSDRTRQRVSSSDPQFAFTEIADATNNSRRTTGDSGNSGVNSVDLPSLDIQPLNKAAEPLRRKRLLLSATVLLFTVTIVLMFWQYLSISVTPPSSGNASGHIESSNEENSVSLLPPRTQFNLGDGHPEDVRIENQRLMIDSTGRSPQVWMNFGTLTLANVAVRGRLRIHQTEKPGWVKFMLRHDKSGHDSETSAMLLDLGKTRWFVLKESSPEQDLAAQEVSRTTGNEFMDFEVVFRGSKVSLRVDSREVLSATRPFEVPGMVAISVSGWKAEIENPVYVPVTPAEGK